MSILNINTNRLIVRFEVYLKKLYYLLHGKEIEPQPGSERKVSLADAIHAFDCLWKLRRMPGEKYAKLDSYLTNLRNWRNTDEGNGGHSSIYMSEEEMDKRIEQVVTMYMYVTGCCLKDLEYVHPEIA